MFFRKTKYVNPDLDMKTKDLIIPQYFKKNKIYIGTPIFVPRNFSFIITVNNKVLDCIKEDFIVNLKSIPETTRYLNLYKLNKKNKSVKYFEANTYYVNQNIFESFNWSAFSIELEDKRNGKYEINCNGIINFKINDPQKLIEFLKNKTDYIDSAQSTKIIENFLSERIERIIEKENFSASSLYTSNEKVITLISEKLSTRLKEIGINLLKFNITEIKFPQKISSELKNIDKNNSNKHNFENVTFEEWQNNNPKKNEEIKPKFVTIIPTGNKSGPFFKESMAPYFFENDENKTDKQEIQKETKKSVWRNWEVKQKEEKSKQIVNLDDEN